MASTTTRLGPGAGQAFLNVVMRAVLATPLLHRVVSNRVLVIDVVGRRTGRRYRIPVGYTAIDGDLLVGTAGRWRQNLEPGRPVEVVVGRRHLTTEAEVVTDEARCRGLYRAILAHNPVHGRYAGIRRSADGEPDLEDLRRALAEGIAVVRLRPVAAGRASR
jgi:hypothetical protein